MGQPFTGRQKIEISVAAILVAGYLLLPAFLGNVCSVPERHQPVANSATERGDGQEQGLSTKTEKTIAAPQIGSTEASESEKHSEETAGPQESWGMSFLCEVNISDWLIGLFTLFLFIATYFLWRETERLAGGADDQSEKMVASIAQATRAADAMNRSADATAENVAAMKARSAAQMRAYLTVLVHSGVYQERLKNGTLLHFEGKPIVVNGGHTPARRMSYWANAGILPIPLPATYKLPESADKKSHSVTLGQHQNFVLNAMVTEVVDDSEVAKIKIGEGRALYVWGRVTYDDIFGEPHFTDFCHHLLWVPGGSDGERIMGYYTEGRNDSD